MSGRRKSSLHSQEPSKQGPSSTQDEPNGSEAKARHPATFDEKDQNYDDLLDSQLKALCWDRGFTGGGTRAGLIQRLRTHDARERESSNFTPPHTPGRMAAAGWLGQNPYMVKDLAVLLGAAVLGILLLWSFLAEYLSYLALSTFLEWKWTIFLCTLALVVVLQVGKCFFYKPHTGHLSTLNKHDQHQPGDPPKWSADSQSRRTSVSHALHREQDSSHPRLDSNGNSFPRHAGEADKTQRPQLSTTPISNIKDLEGLHHQPGPETTTSSSSSLSVITHKDAAVQGSEKRKEIRAPLPQQILEELRRTQEQEILQQKEIEEERFRIMCQRFKDRPDIWVVVRFRDKIPSDKGKPTLPYRHVRSGSHEELSIDVPDPQLDEPRMQSIKGKTAPTSRIFDHILSPPASNVAVFETVKPMIEVLVNGRQVCIMADGQSGSGKSYTMLKGPEPVAALAAQAIFDGLNTGERSGWKHSVECSILEICQERPNDLLIPALKDDRKPRLNPAQKRVRILRTEPYLTDCSRHSLASADEFMTLLHKATKQRATRKTEMNQYSSRSDLVSIISISRSHTITGQTTSSRLYLVDLVGSEKASDRSINPDDGKKIKEGRESLKRAMQAYQNRREFVPKDSQLTLLLSSCFKAPSKIVYLVTASPLLEDKQMTQAAITFASDVRIINSKNVAK